jgi:hypothetical protein
MPLSNEEFKIIAEPHVGIRKCERIKGMPSRHDELKAMAEECRKLAAAAGDEPIRAQLLAVAEHFELLAKQRDLTRTDQPLKPRR